MIAGFTVLRRCDRSDDSLTMHCVNYLLRRNLLVVFDEQDSAARTKQLKIIWLPDGIFVDPDVRYVGLDAINRRVNELQTEFPGFRFTKRGEVTAMHGIGRLARGYGSQDNQTAVTGVDIAVMRDGRISELYALID